MPERAEADPTSPGPPAAADEPRDLQAPAESVLVDPVEEVDALPVLSEVHALPAWSPVWSPVVVQAAAVAATSFVAGAATVAVMRRRRVRRSSSPRRLKRGGGVPLQVVGSRSFLVDVHLLGGRD